MVKYIDFYLTVGSHFVFLIKGLLEPEFSLLATVLYSLLKWAHRRSFTDQIPMQAPQANYALPKGQQEFLTKFWFIEK